MAAIIASETENYESKGMQSILVSAGAQLTV